MQDKKTTIDTKHFLKNMCIVKMSLFKIKNTKIRKSEK